MKQNNINLVEVLAEEQYVGFNQECKYGSLVEQHAVYCHNNSCPYRKCRFGWYTGGEIPDHECPFFKKNPKFISSTTEVKSSQK